MNVTTNDFFTIEDEFATSMHKETLASINDIQRSLCIANNVYCLSILRDKGTIAYCFGKNDEAKTAISKYLSNEQIAKLVDRFNDYDLENVISQNDIAPFFRVSAVGIRQEDGYLLGLSILIGVVDGQEDEYVPDAFVRTTEESYDNTIVLFSSITRHFFNEKLYSLSLENKMNEVSETGHKLEDQLIKNEVITNILKMLESDNDFAKISEDIIRDSVEYLNIANGFLLRLNPDGESIDLICEWSQTGFSSFSDKFLGLKKDSFPFFNGKTYTISSNTILPEEFEKFFNAFGITAAIFLPLSISGDAGMYLCFNMQKLARNWDVEELKFLNDVKRVLQTILIKRITKNSLASSYTALEAILENAGCGVCVDDANEREILFVNNTIKDMFSNDKDMKDLEKLLSQSPYNAHSISDYKAEGQGAWYDITFSTITWVDGRKVRLTTVYDITNIKEYQKTIERQSNIDYLTGLKNRRRCEEDLREEVRLAVRTAECGALLYFDLDDFKNINDGLGHRCGDQLLKEVARSIRKIAGDKINCYRLGGDEFGLLIPHEKYNELDEIIKNLQKLFESSWELDGTKCYCTMSMSTVVFPKDGVEVDSLFQRADIALSYAKSHGKNRTESYSSEVSTNSTKRIDIERCLRQAVREGCKEFQVYYQPLVDVTKKDAPCCGAEALVRWNSKELGFLNPADFVPLAEYLGLIVPIGQHVLVEACKRCKYWNDFGHPEYKVNVNLSVVQLLQKDIVDKVASALKETGINPNNLTLEVTEGLAINDIESMVGILEGIKELGVRVALDDFGTGYSSLNHIRNMPLDVIKIDKCFIDGVGQDDFSDAFVKTVSRLADAIKVNVCVEGVEKQAQKDALDSMHVDIIQGYLYDKPLPQDEFENKYLI